MALSKLRESSRNHTSGGTEFESGSVFATNVIQVLWKCVERMSLEATTPPNCWICGINLLRRKERKMKDLISWDCARLILPWSSIMQVAGNIVLHIFDHQ